MRYVLWLSILGFVDCSRARPAIENPADTNETVRTSTEQPHATRVENKQTLPAKATETFDTLRFLLLASRSPVLIEARVSIDKQAPSQNIAPAIEYTLRAADTNDDELATWTELANNKAFVGGPLLTAADATGDEAIDPSQTESWARDYDADQDNIVDRAEIPPLLTSFEANKLIVFSSGPSHHERQHFASAVLKVIDVNNDEQFTADELQALPETILRYDYNVDGCITQAELTSIPTSPEMDAMMMSADTPVDGGQAGLILYRDRAWIRNHFLLCRRYGVQGRIPADTTGWQFADVLNINGDDQIDEHELQALCTIPPHISVQVDFGDEVKVTANCAVGSYVSSSNHSGQFRLDGLAIQCGAQDAGSQPAAFEQLTAAVARQSIDANRIQLTVHDHADAVFSLLDASGDGRLNPREIRAAAEQIASCDTDGDGQIFVEEIRPTMQFELIRGGDLSVVSSEQPRPVLPSNRNEQVDWFVAMDTNSDGELSRREFLGTIEQFDDLDQDNDDCLTVREVTDSLR